jgi:HK97 gp10 family phage protein
MAGVRVFAGEEFALKLSKAASRADEISKKAIYAGSRIIADQIKSNLEGVVSEEATGELAASFGITPILEDKNGNLNAHLGFDGYDKKGVPNQLKARALESGTSRQSKKPFIRPALNAARSKAKNEMAKVMEEELKKLL